MELTRRESSELSGRELQELLHLCERAYGEALSSYLEALSGSHLLGREGGRLICHGMWVTRWLQVGTGPLLRTAYVELVATEPSEQGRGLASTLMRAMPPHWGEYQLAALCPAPTSLYERLGWKDWAGPLAVRQEDACWLTPEERALILPLANTPPLDRRGTLSVEWRPIEVW